MLLANAHCFCEVVIVLVAEREVCGGKGNWCRLFSEYLQRKKDL